MAKAIKKYPNGLSIRFLKHPKKFYITFGCEHVKIDGGFHSGFKTFEEAEPYLLSLKPSNSGKYNWTSK